MPSQTKLINRSALRQYALDILTSRRPHLATKFTRVGDSFFVRVEALLRANVCAEIETLPSKGKTIR